MTFRRPEASSRCVHQPGGEHTIRLHHAITFSLIAIERRGFSLIRRVSALPRPLSEVRTEMLTPYGRKTVGTILRWTTGKVKQFRSSDAHQDERDNKD